jgi:hypothetical protein
VLADHRRAPLADPKRFEQVRRELGSVSTCIREV